MSVASAETQATFCATLFDEFARAGLTHVVVCPGSRSTPLALAAAASGLEVQVRLDERSAGFFALGIARVTHRPVVIVVTSGTAVAELSAAVVEASLDRVPLIVLSADRPIELHQRGAAQTINQAGIFSAHARFSIDIQAPGAMTHMQWRPMASRLVLESLGGAESAGVAHANLGFTEPLVAAPGDLPVGRSDGGPWLRRSRIGSERRGLQDLRPRRVVVLGGGIDDEVAVEQLVTTSPVPVLADPRSGARRVSAPNLITAADAIVRSAEALTTYRPDQIVIVGAPAASKELALWMESCATQGTSLLTLGPDGPRRFPLSASVEHRTVASLADAAYALSMEPTPGDDAFVQLWRDAEHKVRASLADFLSSQTWSEMSVVASVAKASTRDEVLVASSSMPIRDLEFFGGLCAARVVSNRGANGIDGVVSTALGVAASKRSTTCVIGDLAFLYDVSALVDGVTDGDGLRIVVLDNRGGGIFSFLPQRREVNGDRFEQLFGTPPHVDPLAVAHGFGITANEIRDLRELEAAMAKPVAGLEVLVCRMPDRDTNAQLHANLHAQLAAALH